MDRHGTTTAAMENLCCHSRSGILWCYWAGAVKNRVFGEAPLLGHVLANHRHHGSVNSTGVCVYIAMI